jgi:hypothetical protein
VTHWHAAIDRPAIGLGTKLTVLSDHQVVRVITADSLSIEMPSGLRLSAVVLDRTAGDIRLALSDGRAVSLEILLDDNLRPSSERAAAFSSQVWEVH